MYRSAEARTERRRVKRQYIDQLKLNPCMDCGMNFIKEAMTFDHRPDEEKLDDVYEITNHPTATLARLVQEIKKCEIVCCWCHTFRTVDRQNKEAA